MTLKVKQVPQRKWMFQIALNARNMKIAFWGLFLIFFPLGCGNRSGNPTAHQADRIIMRTDPVPILRRLPNLGGIQRVCWYAVQVTSDSLVSPPGNVGYRIKGFAQLETTKAQEFSRDYQWEKMPVDWKPSLSVTNIS